MTQFVEPAVSRAKFGRVVTEYRAAEQHHVRRGWWLMRAEFPEMLVAFVATKSRPPLVVFAALLNFANYDIWPPSVRIVDPFTEQPYSFNAAPVKFLRRVSAAGTPLQIQPILQAHGDATPFVCLPGTREYHQHPLHSGDYWEIIRNTPLGSVPALLESLYKYGVAPVTGLQIQVGIGQSEPPA